MKPMLSPQSAARVRGSFERQQFMRLLGAEITALREGFCEIRLPFRPELGQQHGFFHAGVVGTLADNAGGYAAFGLMPEDWSILTVGYTLNLLAPGRGETLVARATVQKAGRTLTICRSDVFVVEAGQETLCAIAQVTLMGLAGKADAPPTAGADR